MTAFEISLLALGCLVMTGALLSAAAKRTMLSLSALFVLCGMALGDGGVGLVHFNPHQMFVEELAIVALVLVLFRDGLEVDHELVRRSWRLPLRKLLLGMPLTATLIAGAAHLLLGLDWIPALLLGTLLSPTDPILSSNVVSNPGVPDRVRSSLHLESGLNDGLALPAVLTLTTLATAGSQDDVTWWKFVAQDVTLGLLIGAAVGVLSARLLPSSEKVRPHFPAHTKSMYALGVPMVAYGLAVSPLHGNGFIAVFVSAVCLAHLRPDVAHKFERADDVVEIVKVGVFTVFGALLSLELLTANGWQGAALVAVALFVARPVAVLLSLARTELTLTEKLFMGWFGPRGIASVAFALIVLSYKIPDGEQIFQLAALTVLCSVVMHGLTDTPAANWMARRAQRPAAAGA